MWGDWDLAFTQKVGPSGSRYSHLNVFWIGIAAPISDPVPRGMSTYGLTNAVFEPFFTLNAIRLVSLSTVNG